ELRRKAFKRAGAEDAKPLTGNCGFNICALELVKPLFGPRVDRAGCRISAMIKIDATEVEPFEGNADTVGSADVHLLDRLLVCAPGGRITARRVAVWVVCTVGRLRPFLAVPEPTPAHPHLLLAQMFERGWQLREVAVIGLRFRWKRVGHGPCRQ